MNSVRYSCLSSDPKRRCSVLAGTIVSAIEGRFGWEEVPPALEERVRPGQLFLWPLMAVLWAFDVETVARRSLIAKWIGECQTVPDCYAALRAGRRGLGARLRGVENLPRHEQTRG